MNLLELHCKIWDAKNQRMYLDSIPTDKGPEDINVFLMNMVANRDLLKSIIGTNSLALFFTGLEDGHKKKYYDGDIFEFEQERYEIVWHALQLQWYAKQTKGVKGMPLCCFSGQSIVLKGNRFENPELLEK